MTAYKFWRLSNPRRTPPSSLSAIEGFRLYFITESGEESSDPSRALASNLSSSPYPAPNAFNHAKPTEPYQFSAPRASGETWIGYEFLEPTSLKGIVYTASGTGSVANTLDVDGSSDGLTWVKQGEIRYSWDVRPPRYSSNFSPLYTVSESELAEQAGTKTIPYDARLSPVPPLDRLNPLTSLPVDFMVVVPPDDPLNLKGEADYFAKIDNPVGRGLEGYIGGRIYERVGLTAVKKPVERVIYLLEQGTNKLIMTTASNPEGEYLFSHLSMDTTFILYSIDPHKVWGLEGIANRKARGRVKDGVSIQYPIE